MLAAERVVLIRPPQVGFVAGNHDQVAQAVGQARVGGAGSEQALCYGFRGIEEGKLTWPGLFEVSPDEVLLPGFDEQVRQAMLSGGQDVQEAGEPGMVA